MAAENSDGVGFKGVGRIAGFEALWVLGFGGMMVVVGSEGLRLEV